MTTQTAMLGCASCSEHNKLYQGPRIQLTLIRNYHPWIVLSADCLHLFASCLSITPEQTTLRKFMPKLKYPSIMTPNKTEEAVMKSYKVNAVQMCPRWPFRGRASSGRDNCGPGRSWFRYSTPCAHTAQSRAHPFSCLTPFRSLRWLLQKKSH